jgi:tRNA(Leu) C34 or U34 (ribose-2'-O)-methylase TrmL
MTFFDIVPASSAAPVAETAEATTKAAQVENGKYRRRLLIDPQTRWRCRRCQALLQPPLDAATKKPRYSVMLCEHLEGISSGGTTHLATGVTVCAAGTLRYDKAAPPLCDAVEDAVAPRSARRSNRAAEAEAEGQACDAATSAARAAVVQLLHECQQTARQASRGAEGRHPHAPVPLVFVVVENPKTPANAGGILRAMKCYGVHGPSVVMMGGAQTESASPRVSLDELDVVLQRVGAFIFSGTRLQKALLQTDFASTLRTDPTHAGRSIPQLCLPSLDVLFDVLRSEYGHHPLTSLAAAAPPVVRVVAVELVEGAIPLPAYQHPFLHHGDHPDPPSPMTEQVARDVAATSTSSPSSPSVVAAPMVFYVLGAEDSTLSAHHIEQDVDDVVVMPTTGSMNLAATVNVLLYDRIAKECCGLQPAARSDTTASDVTEDGRAKGKKWRRVFASRNANNRTRWTRPQ